MKKIIITIFAALAALTASAQQLRWGVTAGANISTVSGESPALGFNAGVRGELGLASVAKGLYVDGGVLFTQKGYHSPWLTSFMTDILGVIIGKPIHQEWSTRTYHIDVPLHVGYRFNISDNFNLYVSAGPYMSYGLAGKFKVRTVEDGGKETRTSVNVFKEKIENRFDWGLGGDIGIEVARHYRVGIGYDFGLSNLCSNLYKGDMKRFTGTFSVGYMF